jgi:hypothetical protein
MSNILSRLRETSVEKRVGEVNSTGGQQGLEEFISSGVKFVSGAKIPNDKLEDLFYRAVHDLMNCIVPVPKGGYMLMEGATFLGCWLESTGTINAEIFDRFCPNAAKASFELFSDYQREDGLMPYKIIEDGPYYRQIQMVTPLARSVWAHYCYSKDKKFLEKMYNAICRQDQWLETYRNTRGTGCVESFCTFDTGNDFSPRFWHIPDTPYKSQCNLVDPYNPLVPFLAPDLTANVYCQRKYMALMARELGLDEGLWKEKASFSLQALMNYCYDPKDHNFYDRDKHDRFVRVPCDTLLKVLACEVGDDYFFDDKLRRFLLNTTKYFTRYPLTSFPIDDPRYPPASGWGIHFLMVIRHPRAFDFHNRFVELTWILHPIITALSRSEYFSGSIDPWSGREGFSKNYSPTMLAALDYLERYCGIYPTTEGELYFTSLIPSGIDFGEILSEETGYSRKVDGALFEFINESEISSVYKDGELIYQFPYGVRLITDRTGALTGLIGMTVMRTIGVIKYKDKVIPFSAAGNERLRYTGTGFERIANPGIIPPNYGDEDNFTLH